MRKRSVAPLLACLTLAVPASASAHAKTPTVALDYRLILDQQSRTLRGAHVAILDGDRSLRVDVDSATVVVLGDLNEPMLRITPAGGMGESLVPDGGRTATRGQRAVGGSVSAAAPSPGTTTVSLHRRIARIGSARWRSSACRSGSTGGVQRLPDPSCGTGDRRCGRGSPRPWRARCRGRRSAAMAARRASVSPWRSAASPGLATIASLASFGAADSPNGRVAWVQLGLAACVGAMAAVGVIRLSGERRVVLASLIGAAAAATVLGSLGVFRHAVVISSFSPTVTRVVCALAFTAGFAGASTGLALGGGRR